MTVNADLKNSVSVNDLLYCKNEVIDAIAKRAIVEMINANVAMIIDTSEDYGSRAEMMNSFSNTQEQAKTFFEDMMFELRARVINRINELQVSTNIVRLEYDQHFGDLEEVVVNVYCE